jgi:CheY-like chemotaxis protein
MAEAAERGTRGRGAQRARPVAASATRNPATELYSEADAAEALRRLTAQPDSVDLLITDHHMPGMDGIELVQKVREMKLPCRIMVFCSALSREVHDSYRRCAVDRMLFKPVLPAELRQAIREIFSDRPARAKAPESPK